MEQEEGEVVFFRRPTAETSVFVSRLPTDVSAERVSAVFGECGLLNDVVVFVPRASSSERCCAVVRFYTRAATRAALALDGFALSGGQPIRVEQARDVSQQQQQRRQPPLPLQRSIELCNRFLGTAWSSRITALQHDESAAAGDGGSGGKVRCRVRATVVLAFGAQFGGTVATGRGVGCYAAKTRADALEKASKFAVSAARGNAFGKVALVLLNSGAALVERIGEDDDDAPDTRDGSDNDDDEGDEASVLQQSKEVLSSAADGDDDEE